MKIPETSANVGAYYGNEENGQWQPNGVIIDNGVGGGVVGSGDAGMHRPPVYPLHIPRQHVNAGYVMAGAYYPPYPAPPQPDDFADYMWMENEEEFDKQVLQQLEEEALMEQCIEAMLEDEQRERNARGNHHNAPHHYPTTSNGAPVSLQEAVSRSTLNPLAAEFVPTHRLTPTDAKETKEENHESTETHTEEERKEISTDLSKKEEIPTQTDSTDSSQDNNTEVSEAPTPPKDPPEVSALVVNLKATKKETKKPETKKPVKTETKKPKPAAVKSETKVITKKKEVKSVKNEVIVECSSEEVPSEIVKPQSPTPEESQSGPKPINYAAAAKASKPKPKSATPPVESKPVAPKTEKPKELKPKVEKKTLPKEKPKEKVPQRKTSAK